MQQTGEYERSTVTGEDVNAFIPFPLPPRDPPLELGYDLAQLLANASEQLRLLDLAGDLVPSVEWSVYAFVRKEAVLSAQIEGTQATLMDLLEVEASADAPVDASTRGKWLECQYQAHTDDAIPCLELLGDYWGDLCASSELS